MKTVLGTIAYAIVVLLVIGVGYGWSGTGYNDTEATRAAEKVGWTHVTHVDFDWVAWGCGHSEFVKATVHGTDPQGHESDLTLCYNRLKGYTPRL